MIVLNHGRVLIVFLLLIAMVPSTEITVAEAGLSFPLERIPMKFWRADPSTFEILETKIFPMGSLGSDGTLSNLGRAWITWTLNISGWKVPAYAVFDRGKIINFDIVFEFFQEVHWDAVQTRLFLVTSTAETTELTLYTWGESTISRSLNYNSTRHQVYVTPNSFQLFLYQNGTIPTYVSLVNYSLVSKVDDTLLLSTFPGSGFYQTASGELLLSNNGLVSTVPPEIANTSQLGHVFMQPSLFDLDNEQMYYNDLVYAIPQNSVQVYKWGLSSSIIRTENNTLYEFRGTDWVEIDQFNQAYNILDFSIIDISLYLGSIPIDGIQLISSGLDEDGDYAPDTLESYFGSYSFEIDTDGDLIADNIEIAMGMDPLRDDNSRDYDGDGLSSLKELELGLDPLNQDSDFGGAIDGWEVEFDFDPLSKADDLLDNDNDGVTNAIESIYWSSPFSTDSDNDNLPDAWEIRYKLDPTDPTDASSDTDGDRRDNLYEYEHDTDPLLPDPLSLLFGVNFWIFLIAIPGIIGAKLLDRHIFPVIHQEVEEEVSG